MKSSKRQYLRPLPGALLLLLLAWGSAVPASADIYVNDTNSSAESPYVIQGEVTESVRVEAGGFLDIKTGANIHAALATAVIVTGGTVNLSGGTISADFYGVIVSGGTANLSGGTVIGASGGVDVEGGSANLSGSTISGDVTVNGGTANVSGGTISGRVYGVAVNNGGTASLSGGTISGDFQGVLVDGGSANLSGSTISGGSRGVIVQGGTVNFTGGTTSGGVELSNNATVSVSGGTISGNVQVSGGTLNVYSGAQISEGGIGVSVYFPGVANISGGTISGLTGVAVLNGATATITGGSVSGTHMGVVVGDGCTATVVGCPLALSGGVLTGTLQDGTPINTSVDGPIKLVGEPSAPPSITLIGANPHTLQQGTPYEEPGATASSTCLTSIPVSSSGVVGATPGSYTITYTATDGSFTTTVTRTVNVVNSTLLPDPSLAMSAAGSVPMGAQLTYTIEVANLGSAAQGVIVTNPLPAGTSFVSASGTYSVSKGKTPTVTWNLGTLAPTLPGQPRTLTLVVKVSAKAGATINNTATLSSSDRDLDPGNNSASVKTTVDPRR